MCGSRLEGALHRLALEEERRGTTPTRHELGDGIDAVLADDLEDGQAADAEVLAQLGDGGELAGVALLDSGDAVADVCGHDVTCLSCW